MTQFPISSDQPADVPTFGCVVYVSRTESGVLAQVMNLEGIQSTGASERDALSKLVPVFKQRVGELVQNGDTIPWVDPPALKDGQQKRFIPIHL